MTVIVSQIQENKCNLHISSDSDEFDLTQELYMILRSLASKFPEEYCDAVELHHRFLESEEGNAKNNSDN